MSALSPLHERLLSVIGDQTYRSIAKRTRSSSETVRRYLQGQAPSVEFLAAICDEFDLNANWLFTGEGARSNADQRAQTLRASSPAELLAAIADALELLTSRVDRLERFVQRVDTRFNAVESSLREATAHGSANGHAEQPRNGSRERARSIARALPKRSPEDAH